MDHLWGRCRHTRGQPGAGPRRQPAAPGPAAGRLTTRAGRGPPSAVTGYREGPSHALPGRKFGSVVDHGPTVFRREGRFVPGMDSYQPFSAVGQNLAPGNLRRGSGGGGRAGSRTRGVVSRRAGFRAWWRFRSFLGPLSAHSWTARSNDRPVRIGIRTLNSIGKHVALAADRRTAPGPAAGRRTTRAKGLGGRRAGSQVWACCGSWVFCREGRFVPGMEAFFAVGQNSAPGTLGRARGVRGAGPEGGEFGLVWGSCRQTRGAPGAGPRRRARAVWACRVSLLFVTCKLFRQKASRFLRRPRPRAAASPASRASSSARSRSASASTSASVWSVFVACEASSSMSSCSEALLRRGAHLGLLRRISATISRRRRSSSPCSRTAGRGTPTPCP